jgi:hypothetical protein
MEGSKGDVIQCICLHFDILFDEGNSIVNLMASTGEWHFTISRAQSKFLYFCISILYYTSRYIESSLKAAQAIGCHILGVEGDDDLTSLYLRVSYSSTITKLNDDGSFDCFKDNRNDSP